MLLVSSEVCCCLARAPGGEIAGCRQAVEHVELRHERQTTAATSSLTPMGATGNLRPMVYFSRVLLASRWLVPMLAFLLVLGHACELPAFADSLLHAAEDAHHSADHHADEDLISCDAVGLPSSPGYLHVGPSTEVAIALPVTRAVPVRLIISSPDASKKRPSRPPLFLLFASLLI